jgi:hypothetical protein
MKELRDGKLKELMNVLGKSPIRVIERYKNDVSFIIDELYCVLYFTENKEVKYLEINQWHYKTEEYKEVQQIANLLLIKSKYRVKLLF